MKSKLFLVLLVAVLLQSCKSDKKETYKTKGGVDTENGAGSDVSKKELSGFKLMEQKCYICHFEKPDPSRRDNMLAPPMLRVQEHYLPAYPEKEDFVAAVTSYINNPSEENTLMPGAVKKFKLMPKAVYDEAELKKIVEALYDKDFGSSPKMNMNAILQLNNGKKWKLQPNSMRQIRTIQNKLSSFKSGDLAAYNQLGRDIFNEAKVIMLDDSYSGDIWDEIHIFFSGIEENMHTLMSTDSMGEAKNQVMVLKYKFIEFRNFFN